MKNNVWIINIMYNINNDNNNNSKYNEKKKK